MGKEGNLWNQVEGLEGPLGARLSGEPEVVHEIQDLLRQEGIPISRIQVQIILENVPEVFPEDWQNPGTFEQLSDTQKKIGYQIAEANPVVPIYGITVQKVIEAGIAYRNKFNKHS